MPNWIERLTGGRKHAPAERKGFSGQTLLSLSQLGAANWSHRGFASLINQGFARNSVVYRCVRLIAEAANRVPLVVMEDGKRVDEHPLATLLARPNGRQSGAELLEAVYAYLQTAGNAYLQAGLVDGEVRGLFCLRPDRMKVVAGADGWPVAYDYTAGGRTTRLRQDGAPLPAVLHMALFHPLDDHYGMAPLEAAQTSLDIHNAAAGWNKALLDNAARPSGALVNATHGRLYQGLCDARLGDGRCRVDLDRPEFLGHATVEAVADSHHLLVAGLEGFADGWFGLGSARWTDGRLDGREEAVVSHRRRGDGDLLGFALVVGEWAAPGDVLSVRAGCDRRFATCREKFANAVNFRGFPHIPGSDYVLRHPRRGAAMDGRAVVK